MAKSYNIIRPATHQQWLEQRKLGIGSSEVGTILGVNPWETPYQLWRRKTSRDPQIEENDAMRWGHYLENAIAQAFQDETGKQVIKASAGDWLAVDKQRDFLRVSPDRTYWIDQSRRADNKGILECKSTSLKIDEQTVPQHWFCQLMYQLGVMGLPEGHLAWFITTNRSFGYMHVQFNRDFYDFMVGELDRFWNVNLLEDVEPDIVTIDDALLKFPASDPGKVIEVTDQVMEDINQLKLLKPQLDELTKEKKRLEDEIKMVMQDAETLCLPGTLENNPKAVATWKSAKDSTKFDEKAFAAAEPELYAKYCKTVPGSRRFIVK
jgi:putative phage-type endonuclease